MIRRIGTLVTAAVIAAIGAVAIGSPAQAGGGPCEHGRGWGIDGAHNIYAYNFLECPDGSIIPKPVLIEKQIYTGAWEPVASGMGDVTYYCNGTLYSNTFRVFGLYVFQNTCG